MTGTAPGPGPADSRGNAHPPGGTRGPRTPSTPDEPGSGGTPARWLRGPRTLLALAAIGLAVVVVVLVSRGGSSGGGGTGSAPLHTSTAREAWELPRLNGSGTLRLADFRGHPTVVNFFASWCTPCRGELPGFTRQRAALSGQVDFVFVNSEETGDGLAMARDLGLGAAPLARDVDGAQDSGLHDSLTTVQAMPITAFYGPDGRLLSVHPGAIDEDTLSTRIHDLFGLTPRPAGSPQPG